MRLLAWIVLALIFAAVASCGDSDGDGAKGAEYPDIPGLVVFYQFSGNLENSVADIHHGTAEGTIAYVTDHRLAANSAVLVSGEPIVVADHADLDITGGITIAAWVRPDTSNHAFACVVDKDYLTAYAFGMNGGVGPDTVKLEAFIADNWFGSETVVPYATGAWTHVAFTYDQALGEGKFYVNGLFAGSTAHSVAIGVNDEDLRIGVAVHGDTYKGAIDQVAIFDRALNPTEIGRLFTFE